MEQLEWAALVDTCQNGVLDASRAAQRREFLTDDQVMSVVDENGNTDWSSGLTQVGPVRKPKRGSGINLRRIIR